MKKSLFAIGILLTIIMVAGIYLFYFVDKCKWEETIAIITTPTRLSEENIIYNFTYNVVKRDAKNTVVETSLESCIYHITGEKRMLKNGQLVKIRYCMDSPSIFEFLEKLEFVEEYNTGYY